MHTLTREVVEVVAGLAELRLRREELMHSKSTSLGRRPLVGLVPTMGALHAGHASLIERMAGECDLCIVSIFVNPLQFGPTEDLERYPRTLEADLEICRSAGAELVFVPSRAEFYPAGFQTKVSLPRLSARWCGASRPGHFDGVATVVLKLLELTQPERAYFGEKDYQQLRIIQQMVQDLSLQCAIVPCPTLREADGLALSSRNAYLSVEQRAQAQGLYRALATLRDAFSAGETDAQRLAGLGRESLASSGTDWDFEYLAVVDPQTLEPRERAESGDRVLVAARLGGTRLIDNIEL